MRIMTDKIRFEIVIIQPFHRAVALFPSFVFRFALTWTPTCDAIDTPRHFYGSGKNSSIRECTSVCTAEATPWGNEKKKKKKKRDVAGVSGQPRTA